MKKPMRLALLCVPFILFYTLMFQGISFADFRERSGSLAPDLKVCLSFIIGGIFIFVIRRLREKRKQFSNKKDKKDKKDQE